MELLRDMVERSKMHICANTAELKAMVVGDMIASKYLTPVTRSLQVRV
jgi:hypothetical protein